MPSTAKLTVLIRAEPARAVRLMRAVQAMVYE
jgi:hypothetical protein